MLHFVLEFKDPVTEAHYRAAGDMSADNEVSAEDLSTFSKGEVLHHTLQAACRMGIRRGSKLEGDDYHLYVISAPHHHLRQNIKRLFPGSKLIVWRPVDEPLTGRQKDLVDYVEAELANSPSAELPYDTIRDALGIRSSQQFGTLRSQPRVIKAFEALGIERVSRDHRTVGYRRKGA